MRVRVEYTTWVDDETRKAMVDQHGCESNSKGLATREAIQSFLRTNGEAAIATLTMSDDEDTWSTL